MANIQKNQLIETHDFQNLEIFLTDLSLGFSMPALN